MRADLDIFLESDLLDEVRDQLEFTPHVNDGWDEPNDTSYLSADDLKNPDIVANVQAMTTVNSYIVWWGEDCDGYLGFWLGPDTLDLEVAPIVRLDTEATYELVGATVGDYAAQALAFDWEDDAFNEAREVLTEAGLDVSASLSEVVGALNNFPDPDKIHHELYEAAK